MIEEITVTATKRETSTREVPISLEVVSGDTIEQHRPQSVQDLPPLVPNFVSGFVITTERIAIRGIGSAQAVARIGALPNTLQESETSRQLPTT